MSLSPTSATTPDVIQHAEQTVAQDEVSEPPVLITEEDVMLSTAAAMPWWPTTITRRMINTIRIGGAALHRPRRDDTTRRCSTRPSLTH
ncbi:MAG: hypothetical protein JOZ23_10030 [Mycobacterium sp.]|nr:hypothetical protein [Mycobacterium sp.]